MDYCDHQEEKDHGDPRETTYHIVLEGLRGETAEVSCKLLLGVLTAIKTSGLARLTVTC